MTTAFDTALAFASDASAGGTSTSRLTDLRNAAANMIAANGGVPIGTFLEAGVDYDHRFINPAPNAATAVCFMDVPIGDWEIYGNVGIRYVSVSAWYEMHVDVGDFTGNVDTAPGLGATHAYHSNFQQPAIVMTTGHRRFLLTAPKRIYLRCIANYLGTVEIYGHMSARRWA